MFGARALRRHFPIRLRGWPFAKQLIRRHFPIRLQSWPFEHQPFVVTFRLDYEAIALRRHFLIRSRSWCLEHQPFVVTFRLDLRGWPFAKQLIRRHFPITLQSWPFEYQPFVVTFRLDYEAAVWSISASSQRMTKGYRSKRHLRYLFQWKSDTSQLVWYQILVHQPLSYEENKTLLNNGSEHLTECFCKSNRQIFMLDTLKRTGALNRPL